MKSFHTARSLAGLGLLAVALAGQAGPAPWYKLRSKVDGSLACAQTTLGPGWIKAFGPYEDSRCEKLVHTK